MRRTRKFAVAAGITAAVAGGAGVAAASGGSDAAEGPDRAITGDALRQAEEAALAEVGEGRVTDTEVEDEESYYEVEVTLEDGSQVDVQLDEEFAVVGSSVDDEGADDEGGDGED